ncbi:MAG: hypothetical protein IKI11_03940 [Neisseriaceae bacterium]|nr:hypothetical protein [Neisseriaceae bacterium]
MKFSFQKKMMILQAGTKFVPHEPSLLLNDEDRVEGVKRFKQTAAKFQAA